MMENLTKMSAERARDAAEEFFKLGNLEMAIRSIIAAKELYAHTPQVEAYFTAYTVHKLAASGKSHYEVLAVKNRQAERAALKEHYRSMALLLHPDKNRSVAADGAFKIVQSAWEVLSNPGKRAAYDRSLKRKPQPETSPACGTRRKWTRSDWERHGWTAEPETDGWVSYSWCFNSSSCIWKTLRVTLCAGSNPSI